MAEGAETLRSRLYRL